MKDKVLRTKYKHFIRTHPKLNYPNTQAEESVVQRKLSKQPGFIIRLFALRLLYLRNEGFT